jgi:hypothetical protein
MSESDKRIAPRRRVLKGARIVFNNDSSTVNCVVRNMSETGALLVVESSLGVPEEFHLVLDDGRDFWCRIARRNAGSLGVTWQ